MNQNENYREPGTGRSRAKGSIRGGRTAKESAAPGRSNQMKRRPAGAGRGKNSYDERHKGGSGFSETAVYAAILILAVVSIAFLMRGVVGSFSDEAETTAETEPQILREVTVDGVNITGMSREDARNAILKAHPWGMKVTWQDQTYEVPDLMEDRVDSLLQEIFTGEQKESYTLDTDGLEEAAAAEAVSVASRWDKEPKNASISGYDAETDQFLFAGAESGQAVDQEHLKKEILAALDRKDFDAVIEASVETVNPEISEADAKEAYRTIASFTTKTTSNSKRNTNIQLGSQAINGIVLEPGEEFSFNDRVGKRTQEKGYKAAAAYNNGEVVDEIGGGVCQISSTLYNAVVQAGLETTFRRSHTYEPSYVTPGTDAAVSWGGPDYKFVNNSDTAIGIRANYKDRTVTVSIYGIPILEEGVKYSLESTKTKDTGMPVPTYEEDPTLEPGVEKVKNAGSQGSHWETRLVITKNDEVVSREVDHTVRYKGHAPVILRNTSGTVAETSPGETQQGALPPGAESNAAESSPYPAESGNAQSTGGASGAAGLNYQNPHTTGPGENPSRPSTTTAAAPLESAPVPTAAPAGADHGNGRGVQEAPGAQAPVIPPMPGA